MEDFVTYEQAAVLKLLGFKEECLYHYKYNYQEIIPNSDVYHNGKISINDFKISFNSIDFCNEIFYDAPTLAQAQKWLRKNKKHSVEAQYSHDDKYDYCIKKINGLWSDSDKEYDSYEEALSAGITEILLSFEE